MQTLPFSQTALRFGVDDIDGTVVYYDITKREGAGSTHQELTVDRLKRLIVEADCTPVERDTLYRRVVRDETCWHVEGESWRVPFEIAPVHEAPVARAPDIVPLRVAKPD
jgi:aminodeoxyfutalosine synthase